MCMYMYIYIYTCITACLQVCNLRFDRNAPDFSPARAGRAFGGLVPFRYVSVGFYRNWTFQLHLSWYLLISPWDNIGCSNT